MEKLMVFTWKRLVRSRKFFFIELLLVLIGILGAVLCEACYEVASDSRLGVLSQFNAYTQFTFLIFAFILVQQFAQDIQDGSIILFEYLGFSRRCLVMAKIVVLLLVLLPSIDIIILGGALLYRCSDHAYIGATILLLNLSVVSIVLCAAVLACLIKKTTTAALAMYAVYLVCDLLNFFCYGMTNQADGQSISTYVLGRWIGFSSSHPTLKSFVHNDNIMLAVAVSSAWIILLGAVIFFTQKKKTAARS